MKTSLFHCLTYIYFNIRILKKIQFINNPIKIVFIFFNFFLFEISPIGILSVFFQKVKRKI
jgi:hypothetical protein